MPNWVDCELKIVGNKNKIDDVELWLASLVPERNDDDRGYTITNALISYPKEYADQDAESMSKGFSNGGCNWCVEHWGTKWGFCNWVHVRTERTISASFETAWSPPLPLIEAFARRFPDLRFTLRYYEGGMQFQGIFVVKNDQILTNEESKYTGCRGG